MNRSLKPEHQAPSPNGEGKVQRNISESVDVALDEQQDHETFWNKLEVDVKEILAEVDSVTALGSKKRTQPPIAQRRAGMLRQTGIVEREEIPVMATAERFSNSQQSAVLRRPQNQDEYWSISPSAWLHTSEPREIVLSHRVPEAEQSAWSTAMGFAFEVATQLGKLAVAVDFVA
ncbi:hypothetical protein MBLNU13_g10868t2 [Cladosporium sp. NU13]